MITHYGLFWKKEDVWWGSRGKNNEGKLLGKQGKTGEADYRNFRGVYALFADYDLVYVGQAGVGNNNTLFGRLRDHRNGELANRWNRFCWFGVEELSDKNLSNENALK